MSNSWDPTAFQQQRGGGQTQQQPGGVKLFDPTQFQNPHHQPNAAPAQGGATQQQPQQPQQQYPPNSNASSFFNPEPQPGQENAWDHWGSWNWNTEGQNALVTGQGEGQGNPSGAAGENTTGQQQGQFEGQQQGQQFVGQEQPAGQFYNPEQYQNGNVAQDPNQVAESYPGWRWDSDQQQWVPDGTQDMGQHQGDQGQHFYQGQQPQQAYFDPSTWNSTDPAQAGYQWGNSVDPQTQQGVGQEAGHPQPHAGGQEPPHTVSGDLGVPMSGPELNQSGVGSGMSAAPPTLDITSHQVASVPQSQGHTRENSIDSTASGTVAGFFGRGDDAEPTQPQPFAAVAAAPEATPPIQHLKVAELQRTDSAISNESLQTLNLSADEDSREALDEMTGQMDSLQLGGNQANQNQKTNAPPSQLYAHPGDFSGFGNYPGGHPEGKANQGGAASSGSRESDEQSPMMNDWEIVPPQAHSSTSHSRNNSLDDAINFSAKPQGLAVAGSGDQVEDSRPKMQPPDLNPAGSQSSTTQDSESFTAISSTSSSGDVVSSIPFSQTSSYYPSAASTPFTSPDAASLMSHPSSIPSWQGSPPKGVTAASTPSPVVALPPALMTKERSVEREGSVGSISSAKSSPEKSKHSSQQAKDIDRSLNDTTLSGKTVDGGQPLPAQGGSGSGRPLPPPSPRGSQEKESVGFGSPTRRHHSAFQPVHSYRAKHNMSPATTLWDNLDSTPTGNILLAPAAPLIIPSLGGNPGANTSVTTATSTTTTATSAQHPMHKSSSNSSMERLSGRDVGRKGREREGREREGREREGGRYVSSRRSGEKSGLNKTEDFSKSRDEDNRSLGSLDELDATPDFGDDSRADRSRGYGRDPRDPRYDPYYDRPSSRSDSYREDYRKPRDSSYRGYGYRDPYYDEKYDRPRSRQEEERSSRPSSRSAREVDRPRSRAEYDRDREGYKEAYRGGAGYGYEGYGPEYYYDDRERFYRYYRDSRYRRGYAEEMGQYQAGPAGPQQQQYDSRYAGYYGHPFHLPPLSQHPNEDLDRSSVGSHSRGQTPALDEVDPSQADYYGRTSRPPSRTDADRERDPYRQAGYGSGYGGGYEGYGRDYYDVYYQQQYQYYGYPQYGEQPQQEQGASTGYQSGRMTPPKYLLPHVRVCFGPTGQLVTVLPTRPAEGQPAKVEIHDTQLMLQDSDEMEDLKVFPGPLVRNETHKNDVLMYCQKMAKECSEDVDMLDRESAELIWRLLELLLKQNGTIIGTDIADLLLAGHEPSTHEYAVSGPRIVQSTGQSSDPLNTPDKEDSRSSSPAVRISTDRTVITAAQQLEESTDRFRNLLLYGRKKEALDWAMKRNLWGHALFLASKMDNRTHAGVMTRFANTAMRMNDPLQTLYQLMSGRQPASVTNVVDERWGDWRPHLAMILANHSARPELDKKSIIALGDTLATKHCLHASHFCYLMAQANFGSFSKKSSKLVLIGANHNLPLDEFANSKAVQCTEVYEYAQSLGNSKFSLPQFQVYKFLYACRLADNGLAQEAFHYCEVITRQVLQNPARYHPGFISILYSLSTKLKHGDPQKQHSGHDSADPEWLSQLCVICQGYEEGSIQFKSGSATPATGYGGITPSSESGEIAAYGVENSTLGGMYPQDGTAYATNNSYNYQQTAQTQYGETAAAVAGQGEGTVQQVAGTEQYGQYTDNQNIQQATAEQQQYNWQQQQGYQQTPEQQAQQQQQQQQHYDPSQYQQQQQQQWQNYDYSQAGGYGTEQQPVAAQPTAGYQGENTQADPSFQQHHQQQQQPQVPGHTPYSGYTQPQQRNSLTSQSSATDPMEGDDDDDDDEEDDDDDEVDAGDVAHTSGPQFDYFSAAAQTKVIPPGHRYRTTSMSSQGSTGGRRKRTTSGSSTGSVRAANKSSSSSSKPADKKDNSQKGGAGWFGGLFGKFRKNEMKLPDDKNPSIVWDEKNKVWLNKDQGEVKETVKAPPPKDNDLMGKMPPPAAPGPGSAAPTMNGPPTMNRFSRPKGRGARGQYVDVLNPSSGGSGGSSTVPPSLFNVLPGAENFNASATGSAPQLFNPSAVPGGSSSHTDTTSHQTANSLAPPSHDLSRSSSLSSLSREIQQLTMKAQELGDSSASKSTEPVVSQQPPGMPMMFNPTQMSQPGGGQATSAAGSGMKYGHRRVYPKKL